MGLGDVECGAQKRVEGDSYWPQHDPDVFGVTKVSVCLRFLRIPYVNRRLQLCGEGPCVCLRCHCCCGGEARVRMKEVEFLRGWR